MIYLLDINDAQVVLVPKAGADASARTVVLELKNTVNRTFTAEASINLDTSRLYYNVSIALPDGMQAGEYEYRLMSGEAELSTGIMIIESKKIVKTYNAASSYEQYQA